LSVDKSTNKLPFHSPYNFVNNNPNQFIDPDGNFLIDVHKRIMRNAFRNSINGPTYGKKSKISSEVKAYREAIVGTQVSDHFTGSVVKTDVNSLPTLIGGKGKKSVDSDHFDNMNYLQIKQNFERIDDLVSSQTWAYYQGNISAKHLGEDMGLIFHAVQDFYAHSNYIEIYESIYGQTDFDKIPTYNEAMKSDKFSAFKDKLKVELKTGTYPGEGKDSHCSMNHDLGNGSTYSFLPEVADKKVNWYSKAAEAVATKHSTNLNNVIESNLK
jgi:hypothetical protein